MCVCENHTISHLWILITQQVSFFRTAPRNSGRMVGNPMCSMSSLGRLVAYGTPLQLDRHSSLCCGWNTMTHCHHETIIIFKKKNDFNIPISYLFLFWTVRLFKHSESIGERRLSMSLPVAQNRCSEAVDDAGIARKWRATAEQYASTCSLHRVHRANSQTLPSALPG